MEAPRVPLCTLLLQNAEPSLHDYNRLLSSIDKYYTRLEVGMQDEALRDQVTLNPARTISRLEKSFTILKDKKLSTSIAEEIFKSVVENLVNSPDHILTREQAIQLVGSSLPVITRYPGAYLQLIADLALTYEGMFEHLVTDEKYCSAVKSWLLLKQTHLNVQTLITVADRLIGMCDTCSDHGVGDVPERWNKVRTLMVSLNAMIEFHRKDNQNPNQKENLPPIGKMRALNPDDKKSNRTYTVKAQEGSFKIPQPVLEGLEFLNGPKISSAGHLSHALGFLQNEKVPELLHKALESFPCRVCLERLMGTGNTFSNLADDLDHPSLITSDPIDIFGKKVGVWKVLLSDAATKNAKKLARTGSFSRVEMKLRELASGAWKGKDLSHCVGSKKQKKEMLVPVLQARVTRNVSILWQLDVGSEHHFPSIRQQIVKVWQITKSDDEVETAINHIISLQSYYTPEATHLCQKRPGQHPDGSFFPNKLDPFQASNAQVKPMGAAKIDYALIDMSSKFYNVTEPFLKFIVDTTGREEFPFDLSPEEMQIVGHFDTSSLILGRSGTGKTTCLLFKMLAKYRARQAMSDEKSIRQLLLTRSPFLAAKLQAYARSLIDTQSGRSSDEARPHREKPESFFTMKDEDFPFVCTYDEYLDLIENTFRRANRQDFLGSVHPGARSTSADLQALDKPKMVDFNIFKTEYWSCLAGIVPSGCSPELLFAEIMGVIKGSGISASTLVPLTRAEYLSKTSKVSPAFASEIEREKVYQSFERYERQKKQQNQIDELDRVSNLLKSVKGNSSLQTLIRQSFEEVYVDEIQDLRCLDIVLLLSCLCDARGIHLAGDTAQCISKDSVFRFPEIKALFYDYYELISKELNQPSIAKPVQFVLAKNYRSHQGILSFASWVMAMLWNGFPETIDKLDPEIGQTAGPKPIIFAGFDPSILSARMIGLVKLNDQVADFGAEQVILVRDEASKDKLQAQIGEIALVLTILESKGMEFDDVLVYDFFGGSGLGSSYRCLHLLAHGQRAKFDAQKHAALCSELKHLYVAVTRARKQLWFMETVENSIDPVVQALSTDGEIDFADLVRETDQDVAAKVKVLRAGGSVDPERWIKRAAHLLHQKNFADALFCFKKANDPRGIAHSQAWLHEQEGRSRRAVNDFEGSITSYEQAIALFLELELFSDAADCYQAVGRYDKAAEIWKNHGQIHKAAAFYEKGGHFREASDCFHSNGEHEQAIEVLRRGEEFEELIHYMKRHGQKLNSNTLNRYTRLCNILLKQGRISTELRATTINLLGSDTEKLAFFKEFEMFDQMCSLYKDRRRWFEYYELSVAVGDLPGAMDTLLTRKLLSVTDNKTAESILHYSMAEILLSHRGLTESRPELEKDLLRSSRSTHLEKTALQWLDIFNSIDRFEDEDAETSFKSLVASPILTDFFCFFAVAYHSEIKLLNRSKLMHLPMDIINHAGRVIQTMETGDKQNPEGLMLLCGLWSSPKNPTQMLMLPWSPLKIHGVQLPEHLSSPENLRSRAKIWIQEKFSNTLLRFEGCAFNLFRELFPMRCSTFLVRGFCIRARTGGCHFFHEKPSQSDCFLKLTCLLNVTEVLSRLSILYYQRVMPDTFSKSFLGMRRRWLQLLLDELIFVSSYEHSAYAIATIRTMLQTNPTVFATTACLEGFLFYRIKEDWHRINSFSEILQQVQIAHFLGPRVALSYTRALAKKKSYVTHRHQSGMHPLENSYSAVLVADQIRWAIAERNLTGFYARARELLICMERAEPSSLSNFHSVIGIIEFVTTYVLCLVNPNNAIVIPRSWTVQYLPAIYRAPVKEGHVVPESDRLLLLGLLKAVVMSFCKIADSLERALDKGDFSFQVMGRRSPAAIQKKRIFDYLTTILLNLMSHPVSPRGLTEIWGRAQRVINDVAPQGFVLSTNLDSFRNAMTREYLSYNEKDKLHVICLDDKAKCPHFLRGFPASQDGHVQLGKLLEALSPEDHFVPQNVRKDASDIDEYTHHELEVITSLQRRWRRVMKALADARFLRKFYEGQVFLQLFGLCQRRFSTLPGSARVSAKEKIRIRKLLFTDGVNILVDLDRMGILLRQLKEYWKSVLEDPHVTAEKIEELDKVHGQIGSMETKLDDLAQAWSLEPLGIRIITVTAKTLGEKAREAQRIIRAVKQEMEVAQSQVNEVGMH